ncbi:MAG: hypothetical protein J4O08_01700 [Chloroflexi bacterium]|nr:hypothetical protein [Chloroflexota bacterium]MCI0790645.1 hypothetical protein [Chloroflexota bacterium]MCI0795325.1 hypothetical protein [Chloroflexota bacterium]MCI0840266.1 hypothetical protein [Chloroflexota bacterium]MCI0868404.1 hypothetical protein [Chloroflexota bacterium]
MKNLGSVFDTTNSASRLLRRSERGVTGLETAIILIAFVVVASVFAFTVLSTGIFSAERGKETVYAALEQARGSIELKGSVIANGIPDITLDDGEDVWDDPGANLVLSSETVDKKEGLASSAILVQSAFTTGLIGSEVITPSVDLTKYDSISLWIKSEVVTAAGQLQLIIDDSAGCGSPSETINLPVLAADTWKDVTLGINSATTRNAIACVGLNVATDLSTSTDVTIHIDDIEAQGQITSLIILVANSVKGEPIDLTEPADSNNDGIADSEDRRHKVLISYNDNFQLRSDMYWTKQFVGADDGDDLMEEGERVELTISMQGLDQATPLGKSTQFTLEVKPASGSVLVIQRTTPDQISTVMNLK